MSLFRTCPIESEAQTAGQRLHVYVEPVVRDDKTTKQTSPIQTLCREFP